ncbi:hypothetical protein QFZ27_003549 [Inquilinus ginsengisoli]|uniref:hypothetical protein n=1 Tax=Inquilinus ginsengisoli TaxID=363840 RepID=UPI003D241A49
MDRLLRHLPLARARRSPVLRRVVPDEQWRLAIEFAGESLRLFRVERVYRQGPFSALGRPAVLKALTYDARAVRWAGIGELDAAFLHRESHPMTEAEQNGHALLVGDRNRAPTPQHPTHNVYAVHLYPFTAQPFALGESIGGGFGEMGGSRFFDLAALPARPEWEAHFELAGCGWAIPFVRDENDTAAVVDRLVRAVCARGGM